jgi:hypothetical protein
MRLKWVLLALLLVLAGLLVACNGEVGPVNVVQGSGNVITETREVSDFTTVALNGVGRLVIEQTGSESLTITADDNVLPLIETTVRDGKLIISIQERTTFTNVPELTYNVTVNTIDALELNGAGNVETIDLNGEEWRVTLSGGGNITASGIVDRQIININGAGAYNAAELQSREATIQHNGAGMAVVQVSDALDVTINGVGTVEYIGDPSDISQSINGLGTVRQR